MNYRIPAWMAWSHHMTGLLYWGGMSHWRAVKDPWLEPETYRTGSGPGQRIYNGEGSLLYPATNMSESFLRQ